MRDKEFLKWMYQRLAYVHKENPLYDYMHKFRAIIETIPEDQVTSWMGKEYDEKLIEDDWREEDWREK